MFSDKIGIISDTQVRLALEEAERQRLEEVARQEKMNGLKEMIENERIRKGEYLEMKRKVREGLVEEGGEEGLEGGLEGGKGGDGLETSGKVEEDGVGVGGGDGTSRTDGERVEADVVNGGSEALGLVVEEVVEYKCPFESDFYQIGRYFVSLKYNRGVDLPA
jgi:hypothetical protein